MFLLLKLFDVFECTHLIRFGQPIRASAEAPKTLYKATNVRRRKFDQGIAYFDCRGEILDVIL